MIVALHGFNDYRAAFAEFGRYAAARGMLVEAYDQPGFGARPIVAAGPAREALVAALDEAIRRVRRRHPGVPVFVLGESMGAAVAMAALARADGAADVDGLILAAPAVWNGQDLPGSYRTALRILATLVPPLRVNGRNLNLRASDNIEMLRALGRDPLYLRDTADRGIAGLVELMGEGAGRRRHGSSLPMLVLLGARDQIVKPQAARRFVATLDPASCSFITYLERLAPAAARPPARARVRGLLAWVDGEPLPSRLDHPVAASRNPDALTGRRRTPSMPRTRPARTWSSDRLPDSNLLDALILGVVEGITEFIPVSSTGHLILARDFLGYPVERFDVLVFVIQLAAILAICLLYAGRLTRVLLDLPSRPEARRFVLAITLAFIPSVVLGLLLNDFMKRVPVLALGRGRGTAGRWRGHPADRAARAPAAVPRHRRGAAATALGIGLCQTVSMIPGVSRAGATIMGGLLLGLDRKAAAEFSFFLAIPTMVGASALDLYKGWGRIDASLGLEIAVASLAAFVTAIVVVRAFVTFLGRHTFVPFGWYRIGAGLAMLALLAVRCRLTGLRPLAAPCAVRRPLGGSVGSAAPWSCGRAGCLGPWPSSPCVWAQLPAAGRLGLGRAPRPARLACGGLAGRLSRPCACPAPARPCASSSRR